MSWILFKGLSNPQFATLMPLFLADLDSAAGKAQMILFKVGYLACVILIMVSGYQVNKNDFEAAKKGILGGIIMACAGLIASSIFEAAGMGEAVIKVR